MTALWYLLRTRIKNRLVSMLKSPGSLIGIVVMLALVVFLVATTGQNELVVEELRDISELHAGIWAVLTLIFVLNVKNGLGKGQSLFTMPDVNLLFTSPVSNRRILIYGLVQQMGTSLLAGLFLIYQYGWMRNLYGVGMGFILFLVLAYAATVFCAQLTAMVVYVYTSGHEKRKKAVMWTLVAVCVAAVGYVLYHALIGQQDLIGSIVSATNGLPLALFPVSGWLTQFVVGATGGNWVLAIAMAAVVVVYIAGMTRWMTSTQADYYEDVLQATERTFSAITSAKQGKAAEALPENIRVGKEGLRAGHGASAFYYKLRLESRRARVFILDPMSLIMLAMALVFAFFMRNMGGIYAAFIFATYLQFFTVSTGRWVRELLLPYVYLVPDSAFKKLLYCLMDTFQRQAVEAILMAVGMFFILGLTPLEAICFAIARLSFGILFTAGLLLVERLFSGVRAKWLVMIVMILCELLLAVPGIALAIWVSIQWPGFLTENLRLLLLPAVANIPVALLAIFASRNMLKTAELNNV